MAIPDGPGVKRANGEIIAIADGYRARYLDEDGSGEGLVHIDKHEDGVWRYFAFATFWGGSGREAERGWNDIGEDCDGMTADTLDKLEKQILAKLPRRP